MPWEDLLGRGIFELLDQIRRAETGRLIVEGYRRIPQTDDELATWSDAATIAMIEAEPW